MAYATKLFEEFARGQQDLIYRGVFKIIDGSDTERKIQIRIRRDSYEFQSWALAEIFTVDGWKPIAEIHFSKMTPSSYYGSDSDAQFKIAVQQDSRILLERVKQILP